MNQNSFLKKIKKDKLSLEQLVFFIGNEIEFHFYNKLEGNDANEKAYLLFSKLNNDDINLVKGKIVSQIIEEKYIDRLNNTITLKIVHLKKRLSNYIIKEKIDILNITFNDLDQKYKEELEWFLKKDFSISISYNDINKLLIYNK